MIVDQVGGLPLDLGSFEYDPNDPRSFEDQFEAWQLTRDTRECNLGNYPGSGGEQRTEAHRPTVVTKRRR